jgi:multicomponent K+:H+ antiporter subunit E
MSRLMPYPLLWLALVLMWLILNGDYGLGQVLLGVIISTVACVVVARLELSKPRLRNIGAIISLIWAVMVDIVVSNIEVIKLVLSGRKPNSHFVTVPLELKEPNALAVLACIVTATPGSAWVHYDSLESQVIIHVLDTDDGFNWVETLKHKYERRLLEIFQ